MKFLQVHTFYDTYLIDFYRQRPGLAQASFAAQVQALVEDGFSGAHMMAPHLGPHGYEATLIIANCAEAQLKWRQEHGHSGGISANWVIDIVREQIHALRPDVLYLTNPIMFDSQFLRSLAWKPRLIIGWRAAQIPPGIDWSEFHLMLSNSSVCQELARKAGAQQVASFAPGFPNFLAEAVHDEPKRWDVVFSGQWTHEHGKRNALLLDIARAVESGELPCSVAYFLATPHPDQLPAEVARLNHGARWGLDMYRTLKSGRVLVNAHIDLAHGEVGNMRMFEATGAGSFLLTEYHDGIRQYFAPGTELETFSDASELREKIRYYLQHDHAREAIAQAGQARCLATHSMQQKAEEFARLIQNRLSVVAITQGDHSMTSFTPSAGSSAGVSPALRHNSMERVNELYSDPSFVESYLEPARLRFYEEIVGLFAGMGVRFDDQRVVDVGCGTGHLLKALKTKHRPRSVAGIEYAEAALRIASQVCPDAELMHHSIYQPLDRQFDVVFCVEVLEHLLEPDKALANLASLVAPGGTLLVTAPNGRTDTFEGHINFWSPESWKGFVRTVGSEFDIRWGITDDAKTNYALFERKALAQVSLPLLAKAIDLLNAQRPEAARNVLSRMLDEHSELPSARSLTTTVARSKPSTTNLLQDAAENLNAHLNEKALQQLDEALSQDATLIGAHFGRAMALARLDRKEEAMTALRTLLAAEPGHRKARFLLQQLSAAPAAPLAPTVTPSALLERLVAALGADRIEEAFELGIQAKALKQSIPGLDYQRALCFLKMGQVDGAREALREELRHFGDNQEAKTLLEDLLRQFPQKISGRVGDQEFQEILRTIRPYTMLSEERLFSLFQLAKRVCEENIPGNFVECGVAAGGATALLATVIHRYSKQPRWIYSFDSYDGMPTPTEHDQHRGQGADATGWGTGTCAAREDSVREICAKLGVSHLLHTVKGYFEDTLPVKRDWVGMIALLHMDADWYESTRDILHNLYDRVSNDGLIQVDDYGYWEGCSKAIHEFEQERGLHFTIHPIDGTGVWFRKPDRFPTNPALSAALVEEFRRVDPVARGAISQMSANERFGLFYCLRELLPGQSEPLRFVEVGSYAGASLLLTYETLSSTYPALLGISVDPWPQPQLTQIIQQIGEDIIHLPMLSGQAAPMLEELFSSDGNYPEFIFIDGDHTYPGVRQDMLDYYPLLKPGGLIVFHDYLPPVDDHNREAIFFHHGGREPGIRQACHEVMEGTYGLKAEEIPLLYPTDPTQTQAHIPLIPGVYSTLRVYRKPF